MMRISLILIALLTISLSGCKKKGCTDSEASNYCQKCKEDDGTCAYDVNGLWTGVASGYAFKMTLTESNKTVYGSATFTFNTSDIDTINISGKLEGGDVLKLVLDRQACTFLTRIKGRSMQGTYSATTCLLCSGFYNTGDVSGTKQ